MKTSFNSSTVQVGIIVGLAIVIYSVTGFLAFGKSAEAYATLEKLGYLRYVILLVGVFIGMRLMAKKQTDTYTYMQAVMPGVVVALLAAVWVGLMEGTYIIVNPEFYESYGQYYMEKLQAEGASAAEIEAARAQMESFSWMANPWASGLFYFVETFLVGSIGAFIMGLFFQRKKELATS